MKKKSIMLISTMLFVLSFGATYAYYVWSGNNTSVAVITPGINIYYDSGSNINFSNLEPTATKEKGIVKYIRVGSEKELNPMPIINLYLDIVILPDSLKEESFKWELYKNSNLINSGNFVDANIGSDINLLSEESITVEGDDYALYIWIDGNMSNPSTMQNQICSFSLKANGRNATTIKDGSEVTGTNIVSLSNSAGKVLSNYQISGNSLQAENPTPTSPIDLTSLGDDKSIDIEVSSKNMADTIDLDQYTSWNYNGRTSMSIQTGSTPSNDNGTYLRIMGYQQNASVDTAWRLISKKSFSVIPGKSYTLSFYSRTVNNAGSQYYGSSNQNYHRITWSDGTYVALPSTVTYGSNWQRIVLTATAPSGVTSATFTIGYDLPNIYGVGSYIDVAEVQFEEGSSETGYSESFATQTYTIDLTGHDPLRKVGNKVDYIDYKNGRIIRQIGKYTFTGNETWSGPARVGSTWAMQSQAINGYNNTDRTIRAISNKLVGVGYYSSPNGDSVSLHKNGYGSVIFNLTDTTSGLTSSSTDSQISSAIQRFCLDQYNSGTPVVVYYHLAQEKPENISLPDILIPKGNAIVKVIDSVNSSEIKVNYQT